MSSAQSIQIVVHVRVVWYDFRDQGIDDARMRMIQTTSRSSQLLHDDVLLIWLLLILLLLLTILHLSLWSWCDRTSRC